MTVRELRCPSCLGPLDPTPGVTRCRYCGATLAVESDETLAERMATYDFTKRMELTLIDPGKHAVAVVKVLHEKLAGSLQEAKHLVDTAPCVVSTRLDWSEVDALRDALQAAGATTRSAFVD